jgi:thymidine kinase
MSLELIVGPMFAGKSSAILSIVRRHQTLGWPIAVITHSSDTRYSASPVVISHDGISIPAMAASELMTLREHTDISNAKLIIIEESQFFPDLIDFVLYTVDAREKNVVVVGLDGTAGRKPFGQINQLLPHCDKITKLTALCTECNDGTSALFSHAYSSTASAASASGVACVGGADSYKPLCRKHFNLHNPHGL